MLYRVISACRKLLGTIGSSLRPGAPIRSYLSKYLPLSYPKLSVPEFTTLLLMA